MNQLRKLIDGSIKLNLTGSRPCGTGIVESVICYCLMACRVATTAVSGTSSSNRQPVLRSSQKWRVQWPTGAEEDDARLVSSAQASSATTTCDEHTHRLLLAEFSLIGSSWFIFIQFRPNQPTDPSTAYNANAAFDREKGSRTAQFRWFCCTFWQSESTIHFIILISFIVNWWIIQNSDNYFNLAGEFTGSL